LKHLTEAVIEYQPLEEAFGIPEGYVTFYTTFEYQKYKSGKLRKNKIDIILK